MSDDVFDGLGVLVNELDREEFLKVRETLTRVGLSDGKTLAQTCFVLHKRGQYAIMHHLEMRILDDEPGVEMSEEDVAHRNTVAALLDSWGLVELLDPEEVEDPRAQPGSVAVIPYKEKSRYELNPLYQIGRTTR